METEFTAAGVLPYAVVKRQLYFLLGQERYQYLSNTKVKSHLVWSDFGGIKQAGLRLILWLLEPNDRGNARANGCARIC